MKDWEKFFDRFENHYPNEVNVSIEGIYEMFKARMVDELRLNKKRKAAKPKADWWPSYFERFYDVYPRKSGPKPALKAWNSLRPDDAMIKKIMSHCKKAYLNTDKEFIPHASSYLNKRLFEGEIIETKKELKLPFNIMEVQAIAIAKGIRGAQIGESSEAYRKFVKSELERMGI